MKAYGSNILVIQGSAMAKFWSLHHTMGENRRKGLSTTLHSSWERERVNPILSPNPGFDVSYVTLVIQCGAMAKFGHCSTTVNVWERIGEKHLATPCIPLRSNF